MSQFVYTIPCLIYEIYWLDILLHICHYRKLILQITDNVYIQFPRGTYSYRNYHIQ
jgi:hypothetical protein